MLSVVVMGPRPAHSQTENVLYSFCSLSRCSDGAYPTSSLTPDGAGNFYGTTIEGGVGCTGTIYGCGTVFELSPNGSGGWYETVLYSFTAGEDEITPRGPVIFDNAGNLYGTGVPNGQGIGFGVVFELTPVGTNWTENVLYKFTGSRDAYPDYNLIMDRAGNLYGTTQGEGAAGEVFELSPSAGGWTEQVIYNAGSGYAGLVMDGAGNIYGTEFLLSWAVFELSPNGDGSWTPTVIYNFFEQGLNPQGALALDQTGNIYGMTENGGKYGESPGYGIAYKLSLVTSGKKKGKWMEKVLHNFKGGKHDGYYPGAGIVLDPSGNIYGTTTYGGKDDDGIVFKLMPPTGKGNYKEKILLSFNGTDGKQPWSSLFLDQDNNIYGTTIYGGSGGNCGEGDFGCGVIFEIAQ